MVAETAYFPSSEIEEIPFPSKYPRLEEVDFFDKQDFFTDFGRIDWLIAQTELEDLLLCHPFVEDALVLGLHDEHVSTKDWIPRAFVVLKNSSEEENVDSDSIRTFVDERVASYKKLRGGLYIVPALPKQKEKVKSEDCLNMGMPAPAA